MARSMPALSKSADRYYPCRLALLYPESACAVVELLESSGQLSSLSNRNNFVLD